MSLPPNFLDELRTRSSLSQVVGRKVMWDTRKSNQGKGDMWAPCPFHQEKTASFHVDDRKGYYYCFGCHAKGDAISFIRETENVGFMEAVEILARECGMQIPARDPKAQEKSDRGTLLVGIMEMALQYFRLQLKTASGAQARDYLAGRGLSEAAQDRWDIGFVPDAWQGLWDHLKAKGVADELIFSAGLAKPSQKGGKPYDTFRGRIMFPIRDGRSRCIAFGGRAMDASEQAKYLNSPETALFDKGRSLFNLAPARTAAGKGQPLIVAEGYMDVIALAEAGFSAAVAPLGTAITEDQLRLMWRVSPEPVIMMDGDRAGLSAAMRLIDLALPLLEAGQALRFVLMPEGLDPDDLIRAQGAGAMQERISAAMPMVQLLWDREIQGQTFDSPERKAALDKRLRAAISRIQDSDIRRYYGEAIKQQRWEFFRSASWTPGFKGRKPPEQLSRPETRASLLATNGDDRVGEMLREMAILAVTLLHPAIIPQFEAGLETLELIEPGHQPFMMAILENYHIVTNEELIVVVTEIMGAELVKTLLNRAHVLVLPAVMNRENSSIAIATLGEELAKLSAERGLRKEIEEAQFDMTGLVDEGITWRLSQAAEARNKAVRSAQDDMTTFDVASSGALVDREERAALDELLKGIKFAKNPPKNK